MTSPFWVSAFLDLTTADFERGVVFWAEVTGYQVSPVRGETGEFATLVAPDGDDFLRVQRLDDGPGRVHLDLHVPDPRRAADRAVALGAREVADLGYVVMGSPAGVTFCFVTHPAAVRPPPAVWPDGGRSLVDQVCLDVGPADFEAECAFWGALTGWEPRASSVSTDFRPFQRPDGVPLRLMVQRVGEERRPGTAHLDLAVDDRDAETARHVRLGAEVEQRFGRFTVLQDPTGARYCLTDRDPDTGLIPGT